MLLLKAKQLQREALATVSEVDAIWTLLIRQLPALALPLEASVH